MEIIEESKYIKPAGREKIYKWFLRLTQRLSERQMLAILAVVVGALAGLGTYLFEVLLHGIKSCLVNWFDVDTFHILYLIYPGIGIILATLFVKYIVRDNISEGVTRVLYAMSSRGSRIAGHNCWTSIVGGATTIGFGGSVGPEAPIVLTGAAIGSNVGKLAKLNYRNITLMLCCGAGAADGRESRSGLGRFAAGKASPAAGLRRCQPRANGISVPQKARWNAQHYQRDHRSL